MIISLTGFMGCGKSSYGRLLARKLDLPFIDLDEAICKIEGKQIQEIFRESGEEGFRKVELKILKSVLASASQRGFVLALGGGTITIPEARELILKESVCIFLKASLEDIRRQVGSRIESRPLFSSGNLEELFNRRQEIYSMAHHTVDTDGKSAEAIVDEICGKIR